MEDTLPLNYLCTKFDSSSSMTQIFVADYANNRVVRQDVAADFSRTTTVLPMTYGIPWAAVDLDRDGTFELLVQRGELGFPATGYLDIHRSADWSLRQRFAFKDKNALMDPHVVNLDHDPYLELFVTPGDGSGTSSLAIIIDYDPMADSFAVTSSIAPPNGAVGPAAVADFDDDGRVEFIAGSLAGYSLMEWRDSGLVYIGMLDSAFGSNSNAVACHPLPDGRTYVLLGHSFPSAPGYVYDLLQATGDNTFTVIHTFQAYTGANGYAQCASADVDCDGLDELEMTVFPEFQVWEWDTASAAFSKVCSWNYYTYMSNMLNWYTADFDQNGAPDWSSVGNDYVFRCFLDSRCLNCDSAGRCPPQTPYCNCGCHGDPACDSVIVDVRDVVNTISVAFRGNAAFNHGSCFFADTDIDCSGTTDVLDVVKMIDVAFRGEDRVDVFCTPCVG